MNVELLDKEIVVTLSRRNLLTLLSKLDWPESKKTIVRQIDDVNVLLVVQAVEDKDAYADRPAGEMHPDTEEFLERNREHIVRRTLAVVRDIILRSDVLVDTRSEDFIQRVLQEVR